MTILKVGIASYQEMKARRIARGEHRVVAGEPKVRFILTESFAKVLSAGNRELLRIIAEKAPSSLDELVRMSGRAKSNLSRTLKTMEGYGLFRLKRGTRGRITPRVTYDRGLPTSWRRTIHATTIFLPFFGGSCNKCARRRGGILIKGCRFFVRFLPADCR
jgi:predicted transcriptional regulator